MTTVVVHIGVHRTGSSLIQRFLNANRDHLEQVGVLYPVAGLATGQDNRGHRLLVEDVQRGDHGAGSWAELVDEIEASGLDRVVLSAEEFSRMRRGVRRVAHRLAEYDVQAVMYVRNPVSFLVSAWKQQVKTGAYTDRFRPFLESRYQRADFGSMAYRWAAALDPGRLDVRVYEEAEATTGLVSDFAAAAGFAAHGVEWHHPRQRINASPDDATLAVVRLVGRAERRFPRRARTLARLRRSMRHQHGFRGRTIERLGGLIDPHPVTDDDVAWLSAALGESHARFLEHYIPEALRHHLLIEPGAQPVSRSS